MKIRTDFITNSSSSSFIIGINNDTTENLIAELGEYATGVYNDILNSPKIDAKIALREIEQDVEDCVDFSFFTYSVQKNYPELRGLTANEIRTLLLKDEKFSKIRKRKIASQLRKVKLKLSKYNTFAILKYSDNTQIGSLLEHELMPKFSNTVYTINNH